MCIVKDLHRKNEISLLLFIDYDVNSIKLLSFSTLPISNQEDVHLLFSSLC